MYQFTSESVSEGHPDKVADLISDRVADFLLKGDITNRAAIETLVTTNMVTIAGEHKSWGLEDDYKEIIEDITANDHIDKVSIRYTGKPYRRELDEPWKDDVKSREMWIINVEKIISMVRPQAKSESE